VFIVGVKVKPNQGMGSIPLNANVRCPTVSKAANPEKNFATSFQFTIFLMSSPQIYKFFVRVGCYETRDKNEIVKV